MRSIPVSKAQPIFEKLVNQVRLDPAKEFTLTHRGRRMAVLIHPDRFKKRGRKSGNRRP